MKGWLGIGAVLVFLGVLVFGLSGGLMGEVHPWGALALHYGARNGVAAIVLGARLYDTLLEVLVFALAMVGVRYTLRPLGRWPGPLIPERGVVREGDSPPGPSSEQACCFWPWPKGWSG